MTIGRTLAPWAIGLCMLFSGASAARANDAYTVQVVPQYTPEHTFETWRPVLDRIEQRTGIRLELQIKSSIPQFEAAFEAGEPDVAYMNPYHVIMAHRTQGYVPIIRDGLKRLTGILVVPADAPFKSVADLDGRKIAFPAPNAFGASLYMRALLAKQGVHFMPEYVKTHSNVYRHVMLGRSSAGGGVQRTLDAEPEGVKARLRVLYSTPPATPHPVVVHPRVPETVRTAIQKAFLDMARVKEDEALLKAIALSAAVSATLEDYANLDELNLQQFVERATP